jgi:hypothetical protein
MTRVAIVSVLAILVSIAPEPTAAADCRVGSQQTLTGSMSEAVDSGDGQWVAMHVENAQPCSVAMLMGKGKVPAGCGYGEYFGRKKFTATGTVQEGTGVLMVTSIRCS